MLQCGSSPKSRGCDPNDERWNGDGGRNQKKPLQHTGLLQEMHESSGNHRGIVSAQGLLISFGKLQTGHEGARTEAKQDSHKQAKRPAPRDLNDCDGRILMYGGKSGADW